MDGMPVMCQAWYSLFDLFLPAPLWHTYPKCPKPLCIALIYRKGSSDLPNLKNLPKLPKSVSGEDGIKVSVSPTPKLMIRTGSCCLCCFRATTEIIVVQLSVLQIANSIKYEIINEVLYFKCLTLK